jgi:CheY-like chemotaxis protein
MKKIMIVDDESDVSYTVKNGLESLDAQYRAMCVETGEEYIKILESNELLDVILLDIMLPGMNGWAVYKKLKTILLGKISPLSF